MMSHVWIQTRSIAGLVKLMVLGLTSSETTCNPLQSSEITMPVVISDETLRDAGLTERDALVEIACRLFGAGKLALWPAANLAGMNRVTFEKALSDRQIAVYRPDERDLADDIAALDALGV
jgi:predicted HTH domain antitoxin